jgi:hypothetical protein
MVSFITQEESIINTVISKTIVIYLSILTLEKVNTAVNYCGTFITFATDLYKLFGRNLHLVVVSWSVCHYLTFRLGLSSKEQSLVFRAKGYKVLYSHRQHHTINC